MLSTFLTQLQTYFSKYFVIGSFCPVLAFAFLNGLIAYPLVDGWHVWVDENVLKPTAAGAAFFTTSIVIGVVLVAYVLATLSTFLRRVLEGQWNEWLRLRFIPEQNARREQLVTDLMQAGMEMADLAFAPQWTKEIGDAWTAGRRAHPDVAWQVPPDDPIQASLAQLERNRARYEAVPADSLEQIARDLANQIRTCNLDRSPRLDAHYRRLVHLIEYADDRARARHARLQNEFNSNFGSQELAPTRMGNVANTIQGYALRRYHCNFEIFWSNLQRVVSTDDKSLAALQECKTQLDFLVACCWLTLLSAMIWSVFFAFIDPSRKLFLATALAGPAASYLWYRAAAEQYRSFADVSMTLLDSFRLDLLRDMRIKLPVDVEDERQTWEGLDKLTTFGERQNFQYDHPRSA